MQTRPPAQSRRSFLSGLAAVGAAGTLAGASSWPLRALAQGSITPGANAVLLVVDVQTCFLPGGTLPVAQGDEIIPLINTLAGRFQNVVMTQDWHTPGHASFASSHPGKDPFETTDLSYGPQVLWPDHCVQGTEDAALAPGLDLTAAQLVIRKGFHPEIDSYSAFMEADRETRTGLAGYLKERDLTDVYVVGLATDFCVAWTAQDAADAGLTVSVIEDACRAIDLNGSLAAAWEAMEAAGVRRIQSTDIA
ncbi:bifunctional nicotinamidase/pyrazinamidase [Roseospira navarrensis]|uniref:Nicotinamidase n=1 Tax=Roseospira navarrensis TaxID=140058 RepID=A0A7X1ZHI0_9PROT|nr:bifunctional nicotinamidase/pyrazinamidase [Roseospira navarrensis]MQX37320.1 bifunctional nicotinamidase/pyrazinamidase [Roseospira navarrensis]